MWVFLGFPVGGLEGWSGGPQTSPIGGVLGGLIDRVYNICYLEWVLWDSFPKFPPPRSGKVSPESL